ncbi:CHAT domain-containing protein [Sphingomonas sp. HDW15A]|uniref:CHAT domain-containing protein n=1 Tax=Sphingomonas sp. HDW15A TaxID=2714942 RepID=UPI00140D23C8|nr:CHAT domain-containing protein [Sphingomonas sp. HDW15A]QIK97063.1 CHAT domain-containing protein [Sphingomonas sp. HDW15A]
MGAVTPIANRNSFRIGDSGVMCTAQSRPQDTRLTGIFDRAYALTCRDAAASVGSLIAVRRAVNLATEPSSLGAKSLACGTEESVTIEGIGEVRSVKCRDEAEKLDYRRYATDRGKTSYLVEGLAGYDPALQLALASVVADVPQSGAIRVATTEVSDPAAFARIQAGSLDSSSARTEAYARNNGGQFAQSAEFFETIAQRENQDSTALGEALANQGLQQSNLSNFAAAERLLNLAEQRGPQSDGVLQRLIRNYRAINQLNQRNSEAAIAALAKQVADVEIDESQELRNGLINIPLAEGINRENSTAQQLSNFGSGLRPIERAAILDAQAEQLRGIALRQAGRYPEALRALDEAGDKLSEVRDGKLSSAAWLSADIAVERALVSEAAGNADSANGAFDNAISLLQQNYPESPMLLAARARKAAFIARRGQHAEARALFASIVDQAASVPDSGTALRNLLSPYFEMLARDGSAEAAAEMFRAAQELQRPGVAQTQAVFARQMSEGSDAAADLFRLAVARTRDVARTEAEIATLSAKVAPTPRDLEDLAAAKSSLEALRADQVKLQSQLADYPRYKVLAPTRTELTELRGALRAGEGYYKLMVVGDRAYAIYATNGGARAIRLAPTRGMLTDEVSAIRRSIVENVNGETSIGAFDVDRARKLYRDLFGPVDADVQGQKHLVFEPDGPMLQLPPYLLIARDEGLAAYKARLTAPGADPFDMRGIDWLGRGRNISISVSPRSFLDVRALAPSRARQAYLGLGNNEPVAAKPVVAAADECDWPVQTWQAPISPAELMVARAAFGADKSAVLTGAAFSDTALLGNPQLDDYRILHFATHGLVTAPRPDCPARPALVTSFGGPGSDGLLSFSEIFDLKLNADLVILSACDTAGAATSQASREAGILTGGNYALDGLVRAFVGAGARSVVASHWQVPDDFDATKRLVSGLVSARPGQPIAGALAEAQRGLMDDANTSHPFYWAAFIILGDGAKPMIPGNLAAR